MNPKYHLLVAAAALSLNACSTDDTCPEPEIGGYKISFTVAEDTETRTTLEMLETGNFLRWVSTDKVGIYTNGNNMNSNIETTADVSKSPVEFVGTLEQPVSSGDMFYAYYPYNAMQSTDPGVVLSIPVEQKQTKAGVYNGESNPLVAVPMELSQDWGNAGHISSVRFRPLGAIVELQLYSSNEALRSESIHSVTFESETPLAGEFLFDLTSVTVKDALPISVYESKVATTLQEASAAIPATKDEAARVYLTIAPGSYTGKIVVRTNVAKYTFRLKNTITFERAAIKGLPADLGKVERTVLSLDDPIHFEDSIVKEICVMQWDTNYDDELSYKEAAEVTSIGSEFSGTSILSFNELQYFTGLQSIENYAFHDCSSLTSITIPDGVTAIGDDAFYGCSSLTSINIPQTVSSIGKRVFSGCSSLSAFYGKYASADNRCLIQDGALLAFAPADFAEYRIPDGVTTIGEYAFYNCSSLTSINISDGVTSIGEYAFGGCSSLTSINISDGVTAIGDFAFSDCSSLTSINIPEGVTAIGHFAFSDCSSLTSINIPQTVSSIGNSVFEGCASLSAFYGKYASADHRCLILDGTLLAFAPAGLTEFEYTIPDGVTSIGWHAFYHCSSLTSIHIPDGVTWIGMYAFCGCSSLTGINIPDGVTSIRVSTFQGCSSLTSINIPDKVTTIEGDAFWGCSSLTSIHIPDGVTIIQSGAFNRCSSLTSVNIPDGVTTIENYTFYGCSSLTSVYCKPTNPPTLSSSAFSNTPSSMQIYVPTASVDAYKAAENWSSYASQIFADNN